PFEPNVDQSDNPLNLLKYASTCPGNGRQSMLVHAASRRCTIDLLSFSVRLPRIKVFPGAFDTNASTTMSVCDGGDRERDRTKSVGAFAAGSVSSLHHRLAHFRQRHLDANDGAELGPEWPHQQGEFARPG